MTGAEYVTALIGSELGTPLHADRRVMEAVAVVMGLKPVWEQIRQYVEQQALRNVVQGYAPRAPVNTQLERMLVDLIVGGGG